MAVYFISEENIFCGWQINCIGSYVYEVGRQENIVLRILLPALRSSFPNADLEFEY